MVEGEVEITREMLERGVAWMREKHRSGPDFGLDAITQENVLGLLLAVLNAGRKGDQS